MTRSIFRAGLTTAALVALSATANAEIFFTADPYTEASSLTAGESLITDFDAGNSPSTLNIAAGYGFTWCSYGCTITYTSLNSGQTGLYDNVDLISDIAARPPGSKDSGTGDPGQYFAVVGGSDGGQASLTAPQSLTSLSLLWGSVDSYNYISFYSDSSLVQGFSGSDITAPDPADGDQSSPLTNLEVLFRIPSVDDVNRLVFTASGNSFEFDNLAVTTVPEPLTLSLFGAGLAGAAAIRRRRKISKA